MKLLFLDIDGVVWTVGGTVLARHKAGEERSPRHELDPVALALVGELVQEHNLKVVVSSTWRLGHTVEELRAILGPIIGPRIVGVTPAYRDTDRGVEIDAYLKAWNSYYHGGEVEDFIILDDDRDMNPHMGRLFWTDSYDGFKYRKFMEVERYLKMSPLRQRVERFRKWVRYNLARDYWWIYWIFKFKIIRLKEALKKLYIREKG